MDSDYLRFPFKVKRHYFIRHSILVYSLFFLNFFLFCYEQKKTHERSVSANLVPLAKGFSKHPHIFANFFRWFPNVLWFPFKLKVENFILYSILFSVFVIFLPFFAMNKRRCTFEAKHFFNSNVYMFKRKQKWTTAYQHVISRASHTSVSIKGTFWYLCLFFMNDRLLICYSSRFVSLGFTIRTVRTHTQKKLLRFVFFLPNIFSLRWSNLHPAISIRFTNKVHARLQN